MRDHAGPPFRTARGHCSPYRFGGSVIATTFQPGDRVLTLRGTGVITSVGKFVDLYVGVLLDNHDPNARNLFEVDMVKLLERKARK